MSKNILVVIKTPGCGACIKLSQVWSNILKEIKKERIDIRIKMIDLKPNNLSNNKNIPKLFNRVGWFPAIFLIDGYQWDQAMNLLGKKNEPEITKYVPFGVTYQNGQMKQLENFRYSFLIPTSFTSWIRSAEQILAGSESNVPWDPENSKSGKNSKLKIGRSSSYQCNSNYCKLKIVPSKGGK